MFLSKYENSVDSKGRVSVPAPFRASLGGEEKVIVWPSYGSSGPGYLEGGGTALVLSYMESAPVNSEQRLLAARYIAARAKQLGFDSTGRIVLDKELAAHAGIGSKALFVGLYDRFQVWEPEAFAASQAALDRKVEADPSVLGVFGVRLP